jgi:hypothetical protein
MTEKWHKFWQGLSRFMLPDTPVVSTALAHRGTITYVTPRGSVYLVESTGKPYAFLVDKVEGYVEGDSAGKHGLKKGALVSFEVKNGRIIQVRVR